MEHIRQYLTPSVLEHIRKYGSASLACYMRMVSAQDYYRNKAFLGADGDFITAPEISQLFGEMIGLWCVSLWKNSASSAPSSLPWDLLELGPGKGTMMQDVLRVIRKLAPTWAQTISPLFLDISKAYRGQLEEAFPRSRFYKRLRDIPWKRPLIILANEFFDTLPIYQFIQHKNGLSMRKISFDEEKQILRWIATPLPKTHHWVRRFQDLSQNIHHNKPQEVGPQEAGPQEADCMIEWGPLAEKMCAFLAKNCLQGDSIFLMFDYGEAQGRHHGNTLQATRGHHKSCPLENPGTSDITAHVLFEPLQKAALSVGAFSPPIVTQRQWLRGMGIEARTAQLSRNDHGIVEDLQRLIHPDLMGNLFKVMAFGSPKHKTLINQNWPV